MATARKALATDEGDALSFISLDDLEPRAPPRLSRFPEPFNFPEKPVPLVPDVSLIIDENVAINSANGFINNTPNSLKSFGNQSSTTFGGLSINASNNGFSTNNNSNTTTTPKQVNNSKMSPTAATSALSITNTSTSTIKPNDEKRDVRKNPSLKISPDILKILNQQSESILRIEEKLDKIVDFQDKFLSQLFKKGALVSKEIQTDIDSVRKISPSSKFPVWSPLPPESSNASSKSNSREKLKTSPSRTSTPSSSAPVPVGLKLKQGGQMGRLLDKTNANDSLSAILNTRDLKLPDQLEPSGVYSEASGVVKSLQLLEFNDDSFQSGSGMDSPVLGASASAYNNGENSGSESDSEGENSPVLQTKPSVTFYNNVLGNVNKLLEGSASDADKSRDSNKKSNSSPRNRERNRNKNFPDSSNSSRSNSSSSLKTSSRRSQDNNEGDEVVSNTKKYLETLGIQFGSPTPPPSKRATPAPNANLGNPRNNNYMIQQNVYNSIYIPTMNCAPVPVVHEALEYSGGNFQNLVAKYASPEGIREYDNLALINHSNGMSQQNPDASSSGGTETVYGMTPNNLSFATRDYLQRYGLVNSNQQQQVQQQQQPANSPRALQQRQMNNEREAERILDITTIKNQAKFL